MRRLEGIDDGAKAKTRSTPLPVRGVVDGMLREVELREPRRHVSHMAETPPPSAQPPLDEVPARLGTPSAAAAGLTAVAKTAQLVGGMGLGRGIRALLNVNQAGGFDCQSCAWPSPDTERH